MSGAAAATVKTVQFVDPRIEPQPDPVYDYVIAPTQNQYYKIATSGRSNSNLTFNNLTTLGVDRAYLDTFEIELTCTFKFELDKKDITGDGDTVPYAINDDPTHISATEIFPREDSWTFQSFPFNTCCEEARVNINGGAFFSQPLCYVRAKERYMNQRELSRCYENVCPVHKPILQTETGREYTRPYSLQQALAINSPGYQLYKLADGTIRDEMTVLDDGHGMGYPTRIGRGMWGYGQSSENMEGGYNNSIVRLGKGAILGREPTQTWSNYTRTATTASWTVTWREPLFVSPFSSKYDATYGRPLYNITSLDFSFTLMDLGNMIRVCQIHDTVTDTYIKSYSVNIDSAFLCYQVMTIPAVLQKPLSTLVPYRRFVPYITDYNQQAGTGGAGPTSEIATIGAEDITIKSGVYTLNEIPTAIWVFCAPTKAIYQQNNPDQYALDTTDNDNVLYNSLSTTYVPNWETNKLFGYLKYINISLANTTQILATAQVPDLYRIAKANGCEDSYWSWAGDDILSYKCNGGNTLGNGVKIPDRTPLGAGSVLRLKPGVDLVVPDIPLIPGANANNMVLQVEARFSIPPHSARNNQYALWLLFEYVGVAAISPGQCEITMNPLGSGEIMSVSPVMSATSNASEGNLEGSGFWDGAKKAARIAGQLANDGILSKILRRIPGAQKAASWAESHGLGEPGCKRPRGGAVIGHGLNEWV